MKTYQIWNKLPVGSAYDTPMDYYPTARKISKAAVVIFPGGSYCHRAPHEGESYAQFFNAIGMDAFVCQYSVKPNGHPYPLLDARRAIQWVRAHAEELDLDPNKIGAMGSSAGGHLTASLCTVPDDFSDLLQTDEIDQLNFTPSFQILCYPVISLCDDFGHTGSGDCLLEGTAYGEETRAYLAPHKLANENTPSAFIWHTVTDQAVPVENSLFYTSALHKAGVSVELHTFPKGSHGLGTAYEIPQARQWTQLLAAWLHYKELL